MRTITVGALNIVMPTPHSPQRYIELFQKAFRRKEPVRLRGDFVGLIGGCRLEENYEQETVLGEFYKFFDLNLDGQWFNTLEQRPAEEVDLAEISIPEHLKPHFQSFSYIFYPRKHRLFFISKDQNNNLSPLQVQKLLTEIFDDYRLVREFGEIEITIEPCSESLERILSMPRLKSLRIEISPPNPDDHQEAERKLFAKMNSQNAQKVVTDISTRNPNGLLPDDETKTLAKIAQSNGKVVGHGENEAGQTIDISTAEHPLLEKTDYDPAVQARNEAFLAKAHDLLLQITRRV